jgi:hypothetical protein
MGNDRRKKAATRQNAAVARKGMDTWETGYTVSPDVKVLPAKKSKGPRPSLRGGSYDVNTSLKGAADARIQNARLSATPSKSEAKANQRGLKAANEVKKVPMENVSKTATRIFGVPTTAGKPKMVAPGSKKAAKLKAKSEWSDAYEKKVDAKFNAQMEKEKSRRKSGKK